LILLSVAKTRKLAVFQDFIFAEGENLTSERE